MAESSDDPALKPALRYKLKQCRYGPMLFNAQDVYVGRSFDLYGEYCEVEIELLRRLCQSGDVILDIGANIGADAIPLARHVGANGRILAFEPQRLVFQMLCANIALNSLSNVACYWQALGREAGHVVVPPINYAASGNFGGITMARDGPGERVAMASIDSFDLPACALMKIDVEGMEQEVLIGAARTIAKYRPRLYVENDGRHDSPGLITYLTSLGYRLYWHLPPLYSPANHFRNETNVYPGTVCVNMLCLPPGDGLELRNFRAVEGPHDAGLEYRRKLMRQGD